MSSISPRESPLAQARERLAQRTLVLSTLLFPLAVLAVTRSLSVHTLIQAAVLLLALGIGWAKFSARVKSATVVLGLAISAFCSGLPAWGFAAGPMATATLLCLYSTLLYGRAVGLGVSVAVVLTVLGIGAGHATGHFVVAPEWLEQTVAGNWQRTGVAVASFLILPVLPIVNFLDEISLAARSRAAALDATIAEEARREDAVEEQRAAQVEVREAQRQRTLGRMAGGLAHEINGVLQEIEGWIEVLRREGDQDNDEHDEAVREMRDSVRRAAAVGRRLLYVGGQNLSTSRPTDLAEFLERVQGTLATAAGPHVQVTIAIASCPWVQVDTTELTHVLVNLVVNARDALRQGGQIRMALEATEFGASGKPGVRLRVEDDGPGIAPDVLPHVFEPFFTTKGRRGTGLGLAIVRRLIEGIGGTVAIRSGPTGTSVDLEMPGLAHENAFDVAGRAAPRVSPGPASTGDSDVRPQLLFVEDQPSIRQVFSKVVPRFGIEMLCADSADTALEVLDHTRPDLIWSDAIMPGRPVQDLISRAEELGIPIVICSGHVEEELLRRDLRTHYVEFVPKPYTARQLVARVRQAAIERSTLNRTQKALRSRLGAADRALQATFSPLRSSRPPRFLRPSSAPPHLPVHTPKLRSEPAPTGASEPPVETTRSTLFPDESVSAVLRLAHARAVRPLTVLLADDDPSVRRALKRGLERLGMVVLEAVNGKAAEVSFLNHFDIDVVVLDANMPEQDGETTARFMLQARPSARVVLYSGYGVSGLSAVPGVSAVLSKPISLPHLAATLRRVVDGPAPERVVTRSQ